MAKILLIDDDAKFLDMLEVFFDSVGWAVVKTSSGKTGLQLAEEENPDVVLCDVNLGDMDGFDVAQSLRSSPKTASLPLILFSGDRKRAEDIIRALDGGCQGYILKPTDLRIVQAKIEAVLRPTLKR